MKTIIICSLLLQIIFLGSFAQSDGDKPEDELYESTPSSPPLVTDDTDTPGTNGYELNIYSENDFAKGSRSFVPTLDANVGLGEKVQLRISKGYTFEKINGEKVYRGVTATSIGLKYRFYDKNGLSLAAYPSFQVNDASRRKDTEGNPIPSDGRSIFIPLLISKEVGKNYTIIGNIGYQKALDRRGQDTVFESLAIGRNLGPDMIIMAEIESTSSPKGRNRETYARVGFVKAIQKKNDRNISVFASVGRQIGSPDENGHYHTIVFIGLHIAGKFKKSQKP